MIESLIPWAKQMASESDKPFLHFEIIISILKRLPVKSIVRFQCVCEDWKNLFKTPSFIAERDRHFAQENSFLLVHAYDYNYTRSSLRLLNHKMETAEVLSIPWIDSFRRDWRIVGSCNGLLCVEIYTDHERFPFSLFLWNPVTNEVREVPQTLDDYSHDSGVGFGFSSVVNDSKIVRFYHPDFRAEVYSLRTGSWKELDMGDLRYVQFSQEAVSANGTIFWFGWGLISPLLISFDIATEVFTSTPIHTFLSIADIDEHGTCPPRFAVYGNKLAMWDGYYSSTVFEYSETYSIHMWVVEKGASESGENFSCTEKYKIGRLSKVLQPLCIWRNEIVCICTESEESDADMEGDPKKFFYLFNLTTKEWKKFHNFSAAYDRRVIFNYERSLACPSASPGLIN